MELIRNSLLLAGIDALWQQFFVGLFLILAVLLEQIRNRGRWLDRDLRLSIDRQ